MKNQRLLLTFIGVVLTINAVFLGIIAFRGCEHNDGAKGEKIIVDSLSFPQWRKYKAASVVKDLVKKDLFYPDSYDPVEIRVDSLFYSYMTDSACLDAATKLVKLKANITGLEDTYQEAQNNLQIFGSSGVFWRHRKERDEAAKELREARNEIAKYTKVIKERDTSNDGKFIGWLVYCRYRAQTNDGSVAFANRMFILNASMDICTGTYDINKIEDVQKEIESVLGKKEND